MLEIQTEIFFQINGSDPESGSGCREISSDTSSRQTVGSGPRSVQQYPGVPGGIFLGCARGQDLHGLSTTQCARIDSNIL